MFEYEQKTGKLFQDGSLLGTGYAGHPPHVNDPDAQSVHNVGPIPAGTWSFGPSFQHPMAGPLTMRLTPDASTNTFGRDGFMIHGDTPQLNQSASDGCIILSHALRALLDATPAAQRLLHVVASRPAYTPDYEALYAQATILPAHLPEAQAAADQVQANQDRYTQLSLTTNIPWWWIGAIHYREADCDFTCHLHNGDPLTGYTVNVPAMRPAFLDHPPPFTWEESAADALMLYRNRPTSFWTLQNSLHEAESYNGFGYRNLHQMPSPYLWGCTSVQTPGKYTSDDHFDATVTDTQVGVAAIWKLLQP